MTAPIHPAAGAALLAFMAMPARAAHDHAPSRLFPAHRDRVPRGVVTRGRHSNFASARQQTP